MRAACHHVHQRQESTSMGRAHWHCRATFQVIGGDRHSNSCQRGWGDCPGDQLSAQSKGSLGTSRVHRVKDPCCSPSPITLAAVRQRGIMVWTQRCKPTFGPTSYNPCPSIFSGLLVAQGPKLTLVSMWGTVTKISRVCADAWVCPKEPGFFRLSVPTSLAQSSSWSQDDCSTSRCCAWIPRIKYGKGEGHKRLQRLHFYSGGRISLRTSVYILLAGNFVLLPLLAAREVGNGMLCFPVSVVLKGKG